MRNLPDTTELKKEGPVLTLSLSDSEACVLCLPQPELHVQEAQVILHGRTQESGTPTQASCCRVEPQARSWEGQDPGVKVLRHSGPQAQSLQTVVEPPAGTPPPPGPRALLPFFGQLSSGNQLVWAPCREVWQEGERKEDRGLGKEGRRPQSWKHWT